MAKTGKDEKGGAGPEEMPRNAAQEDVTASNTEGNRPGELLRETAIKKSVTEKVYETMSGSPEEPLRDTAALKDDAANDAMTRTPTNYGES